MLALNNRVVVIDDDDDGRDTIVDQLDEHNFEGVGIEGPFGSDIDRLLKVIDAEDPGFVICDHRLNAKQFASFSGLQVVKRLIELKRPAMLLTTFQDPERIALRLARSQVPVIKGRDRFHIEDVSYLRDVARAEIEEEPVASRKPHRVLIRVEAVRDSEVDVVVPSWNKGHAVVLPKPLIGETIRNVVKVGDRLLGEVNVGATNEDELYFKNINEIIESNGDPF
ncbi:ANTAR domain-containing protein [Agrobacterium pusense]|uniref:hypothetical protein n=1 Tax=Agrobacterium pusense TaxID=648995 RepID=UPI00384B95C1